MKETNDAAGRLDIPKEIRRKAGLRPGTQLEIRRHDGRIEIEPAATPVRLVRRGQLLVAAADATIDVLTVETVDETREVLACERC